jgi:hypothetical protein
MFDLMYNNLVRVAQFNLHMQQDLFKKWIGVWPGGSAYANGFGDQFLKVQERWAEFVAELVKKQRATLEPQFQAGLAIIEDTFHLAEVKGAEELRVKSIELWQKAFDCLRKLCTTQFDDFQTAVAKWTEFLTKMAVPEPARVAA